MKYDYHNAKVILKAQAVGADPERLLLAGGRYDPRELLEGWRREELQGCSEEFQRAMAQAWTLLRRAGIPSRPICFWTEAAIRRWNDWPRRWAAPSSWAMSG